MDMRELKGLEIAARSKIEFDGSAWLVPSQSGKGKYRVLLSAEGDSCNCDDFALNLKPCKHVHAARIVRERDHGGKSPKIDTDVVPKRPTYRQVWPAYNKAQAIEKHRLQELLFDLCRGIEEPDRGGKPGHKPHTLRDSIFAMAFKVYSTFSSRRFNCDLADAHAMGYLSRPVPGMKVPVFFANPELTPILHRLITLSSLPLKTVETVFAPDSTGFSTSRFVRWYDEKYGVTRSGKDWVKAHAICGVKTNVVVAVTIEGRDAGDSPQFKPLVEATAAAGFTIKEVPADKAYLSHENLEIVESLGGTAFVPFKSNSQPNEPESLWGKMFHYFQFRRDEFLGHYHQRSNAESTFSMVKAKFRDHVRSKTDVAMKNEVLCKFICHNICCLIQAQCELGIEAVFWPANDETSDDAPAVLPMIRPAK
jgi:transposase